MTWAKTWYYFFLASPLLIPLMIIAPVWAVILAVLGLFMIHHWTWIRTMLRIAFAAVFLDLVRLVAFK
jgi:uncharacterized ion transporter superfamily protein YfcC